jgi:hypothetical protein
LSSAVQKPSRAECGESRLPSAHFRQRHGERTLGSRVAKSRPKQAGLFAFRKMMAGQELPWEQWRNQAPENKKTWLPNLP